MSAHLAVWHYQPYKQKWRPQAFGWDSLSPRERMVAVMTVSPMTITEIAAELKISPKTVQTYRYRVMTKLQLGDVVTLAYYLLNRGKIQNPFASEPNG